MGVRRGGFLGLVAVLGFATILGGCSNDKKLNISMQEAAELREKNASLEQALRDKDARLAELESQSPTTTFADPMSEGRASGTGNGNFSRNRDGNMVAEIAGNVLFDSGSATIKTTARKTLDGIASEIKRKYPRNPIRVEGHTDSDPITKSKWGTNDKLSQARADAVRQYLNNKGVQGRVEAMGFGASQPKSTKATSRRVEIVVVTE